MTKYRIKRVTNVAGIEVFFPEMDAPANPEMGIKAGWQAVPWHEAFCPNQLEAQAAIKRHQDRQTKEELYIPVE